jgi:hypothetical protein
VGEESRLPKWETLVWKLSGKPSRHEAFRNPLSSYFWLDTRFNQIKKEESSIITKASGSLG